MTEKGVILYLEQAKTLEFALYTHTKLKDLYLKEMRKLYPKQPVKKNPIDIPEEPQKPIPYSLKSAVLPFFGMFCIMSLATLFIGALAWVCMEMELIFISAIIWILVAISALTSVGLFLIVLFSLFTVKSAKRKAEEELAAYYVKKKEYECEVERITKKNKEAQAKYEQDMIEYNAMCKRLDEKISRISKELSLVSLELDGALADFYKCDIIYPKYRNVVAIATIYEYLSSGRCTELTGPNGAYNLFEMELRQNIIICQLSSILKNLEEIKSNQYVIYQEIYASNRCIHQQLQNIGDELAIGNYHANIRNIIEASPKVITGVIV